MYTFYTIPIHILHVRLIESKHEAAKYICYQLSTEQLSTKLNTLRMTYNNLEEFYIAQLNSLLVEIST